MPIRIIGLPNHSFAGAVALLVAGLFPASSNAEVAAGGFAIMVLDAVYSTDLSTRVDRYPDGHAGPMYSTTQTQTTTSASRLDNELVGSARTVANAQADMFSVSSETIAYPDLGTDNSRAGAFAQTVLIFTTLRDELGSISLDFAASGLRGPFTSGAFNLYDRTFNQSVLSYGWGSQLYPECSEASCFPWLPQSLAVAPQLYASHVYEMSLQAYSNANMDGPQAASIRVSGMQPVMTPVPEPQTYAAGMVGFGMLWLVMRRRKGKMV